MRFLRISSTSAKREGVTIFSMVALAVIEAMVLFPENIGPAFVSYWTQNLGGSNLEVFPPALIGLLILYAKWVHQSRAVEVGTILVAAIAPIAAMALIKIDDGPTFWAVLVCIAISLLAVARHVPRQSRLHFANIALVCSGASGAIALNVPAAIEPDSVEQAIQRIFTWATIGLFVIAAILYFCVNVRQSLWWGAYIVASTGLVMVTWLLALEPVHERSPVIGLVLVYGLIGLLGFAPAGYASFMGGPKNEASSGNP